MNINKALSHADFTVIEGGRKCGKITFFFHLLNHVIDEDRATIISAANQEIFLKKISIFKESIPEFKDLSNQLDFFFLKEGWKDILKRFGQEFLLNDLGRIFREIPNPNVFIDNLGEMFDLHEQAEIPGFVRAIHQLARENNKKLFISLSKSSASYPITHNILLNFLDIVVELKHSPTDANCRLVDVPTSNYPLEKTHHQMTLTQGVLSVDERKSTTNNSAAAAPTPAPYPYPYPPSLPAAAPQPVETKQGYDLLLISENEQIIKFHEYILGRAQNVRLDTGTDVGKLLPRILAAPEIIIYNPSEQEMDFSVCEIVQKHKLKTDLFYVCNREFTREQDKINSHRNGCREFFNIKTRVIDYVLALENSLGNNFYTDKMPDHSIPFNLLDSHEELETIVKQALEQRLFFSVFTFSFNKFRIAPKELQKYFREGDYALIDHQAELLHLYCAHAQKENGTAIIKKLKKIDSAFTFQLRKSVDALELFFEQKNIF